MAYITVNQPPRLPEPPRILTFAELEQGARFMYRSMANQTQPNIYIKLNNAAALSLSSNNVYRDMAGNADIVRVVITDIKIDRPNL